LLESATGYATGAIYYDAQIQKSRLPAEGMMEGVVVIKTHETNTTLEDYRVTMRRKQNLPPLPFGNYSSSLNHHTTQQHNNTTTQQHNKRLDRGLVVKADSHRSSF